MSEQGCVHVEVCVCVVREGARDAQYKGKWGKEAEPPTSESFLIKAKPSPEIHSRLVFICWP